jgi:hypothetical protein
MDFIPRWITRYYFYSLFHRANNFPIWPLEPPKSSRNIDQDKYLDMESDSLTSFVIGKDYRFQFFFIEWSNGPLTCPLEMPRLNKMSYFRFCIHLRWNMFVPFVLWMIVTFHMLISWFCRIFSWNYKVPREFMSIWAWNRQTTFAIGASDITQGVEGSQSMKETQTTNPWKKTLKNEQNY